MTKLSEGPHELPSTSKGSRCRYRYEVSFGGLLGSRRALGRVHGFNGALLTAMVESALAESRDPASGTAVAS